MLYFLRNFACFKVSFQADIMYACVNKHANAVTFEKVLCSFERPRAYNLSLYLMHHVAWSQSRMAW